MIRLLNGYEINYTEDFDKFFQNLLEAIIFESKQSSIRKKKEEGDTRSGRDIFLQEIMDNCIYVTHQLFTLYQDNEKLTKFIVTGFIFNSIMMSLPGYSQVIKIPDNDGADTVH
jgi:hypothetical protein